MDLATAQANYDAALAAYRKAVGVKAAGTGDRQVTYQDIEKLRAELDYWDRLVNGLTAQAAGGAAGYSVARWTR